MITGHEKRTQPLNEEGKEMARMVKEAFLNRPRGKDHAVTADYIASALESRGFKKPAGSTIRKIINYIRINYQVDCLVASSDGYYVAETAEDSARFIKSLKERRDAIDEVLRCMADQHRRNF